MAHFLVSIVLLTDAIVLVSSRRATRRARRHPVVTHAHRRARSRAASVSRPLVLFTGTVVTGAGPHSGGGKHDDVARLDFSIEDVARVHSAMVWLFLAAVLVMLWLLRRDRAPGSVQQRVTVLLVLLVVQGAIGYIQYFNDIPALLVGFHVAGATAVWSATLCSSSACTSVHRARGPRPRPLLAPA